MQIRRHLLLLITFPILIIACINQDYDLSEIDKTINVGGDSLAIPFGRTDAIKLTNILKAKDNEMLVVLDDGSYALRKEGSQCFSLSLPDNSDLMIQPIELTEKQTIYFWDYSIEQMAPYRDLLPSITKLTFGLTNEFAMTLDLGELPSALQRIDSISFDNTSLKIGIDIDDLSLFNGFRKELECTILIPDGLKVARDGTLFESKQIIIKQELEEEAIGLTLDLISLVFPDPITQTSTLSTFNWIIDFKLNIYDPTTELISQLNSEEASVNYTIAVESFEPKKLWGVVDYSVDGLTTSVSLGEMPSSLMNDAVLDFPTAYIDLNISSNLGTPVKGRASLATQQFEFSLPASNSSDHFIYKDIWLSPTADFMPQGYEYREFSINDLINPIPETIDMELVLNTDVDNESHLIELDSHYELMLEYDITLPLAFGEDLSINISDTITNVPSLITRLIRENVVVITTETINTFPLDFELTMIPLNEKGDIMEQIHISSVLINGIKEGDPPTLINKELKLYSDNKDVEDIKSLILNFRVCSSSAGIPISSDDYIEAQLGVKVDGGLNLTISDLEDLINYEK